MVVRESNAFLASSPAFFRVSATSACRGVELDLFVQQIAHLLRPGARTKCRRPYGFTNTSLVDVANPDVYPRSAAAVMLTIVEVSSAASIAPCRAWQQTTGAGGVHKDALDEDLSLAMPLIDRLVPRDADCAKSSGDIHAGRLDGRSTTSASSGRRWRPA